MRSFNRFRKHIVREKIWCKILYGLEANIVDDGVPIAYNEAHRRLMDDTFVVFDVETTGLSAVYDTIIELAAVKVKTGKLSTVLSRLRIRITRFPQRQSN